MPLGLLDNPTLMTLKDDGLVPGADTFPAEPLWSWRGIYSPTASTQDRALLQHCPCPGTHRARRHAWHSPGAGASAGTSRSPPRGTAALAALPYAWSGQNLTSSEREQRGPAPACTHASWEDEDRACHAQRTVIKNSSFKSPSRGNNGLRFIFLVLQKLL